MESLATCKIKVIDYGNAYLHHDQRCSYVQSRAYRAPEVVLGLPYSPKVDMWSLGCILMELFTGKLLYDNKSVQSLLASHIALCGEFPEPMVQYGSLARHYLDQTPCVRSHLRPPALAPSLCISLSVCRAGGRSSSWWATITVGCAACVRTRARSPEFWRTTAATTPRLLTSLVSSCRTIP